MSIARYLACIALMGVLPLAARATEVEPTPGESPSQKHGDTDSPATGSTLQEVTRTVTDEGAVAVSEGDADAEAGSSVESPSAAPSPMGSAGGAEAALEPSPPGDLDGRSPPEGPTEDISPPAVPALAAEKRAAPLIAVLDLRSSEGAAGLASALATVITAELNARDDVRAVSRSEIQAILAHKADQALLGCESVKCAADLGKLVEADLVIVGSIEQVATAYVFSLSLIDPVVPEVKERVEATWRSGPDEIVILARPYVDRLLGGANAGSYVGALDVLAPDGAQVFVDGKEVGTAPLSTPLPGLPIGVHVLEVVQGGHYTSTRDVVITRGETTVVRIELEEQPFWTRWWFWTASGGAATVALASGTALALYLSVQAETAPPPTTLKVRTGLPAELQ